jgi:hypothetical protein
MGRRVRARGLHHDDRAAWGHAAFKHRQLRRVGHAAYTRWSVSNILALMLRQPQVDIVVEVGICKI